MSILQAYFSLPTNSLPTFSVVSGVLLGIYFAFHGDQPWKWWLSVVPSGLEFGKQIFDQLPSNNTLQEKVGFVFRAFGPTLIQNHLPLLGLVALFAVAYLFGKVTTNLLFLPTYPLGRRRQTFVDAFCGGLKNIDERVHNLLKDLYKQKSKTIGSYNALTVANTILDDFERRGGAKTEETANATIRRIMDYCLAHVFGRDAKFRGVVYLRMLSPTPNNQETLKSFCSTNLHGPPTSTRFEAYWPIGGSYAGYSFKSGSYAIYPNMKKELKKKGVKYGKSNQDNFSNSFLTLPIEYDGQRWGVLSIDSDSSMFPNISDEDLSFLNVVCYNIGYVLAVTPSISGFAPEKRV